MASYIKLDFDWYDDPKILVYEDTFGKESLVDVVKLFCALGEFHGIIDLNEPAQRLHIQKVLGLKGEALDAFLDQCALCEIIRADWYQTMRKIGSDRSLRDGDARKKRRNYAKEASDAAKAKRQAKRE